MASKSAVLNIKILADASRAQAELDKADRSVGGFAGKFGKVAKVGGAVGLAFAAAVPVITEVVGAASDMGEAINKAGVLFGDASKDVEKFASEAADKLGQSKLAALNAASTFATFGKSAGLAGADLTKFSTEFVTLASDMASFHNTSPEEAIEAIGSALRGEAEPIRKYGVLLNDATLKNAALKLGLIKTTKEALTPQQKVLAAQAEIYRQTGTAQGDFARTSGGLANQQRILAAKFEDAKAKLGEKLLPVLTDLANYLTTKVIPAVEKAWPTVERVFGLMGTAARVLWNVYYMPMFKLILTGIGTLLLAWGKMLQALGKVPGFEWAKKAGDKMVAAGKGARELAENLKKIPAKKEIRINTPGLTGANRQAQQLLSALLAVSTMNPAALIPPVPRAAGTGGTSSRVPAGGTARPVQIVVQGALDPVAVSRQIATLLRQQNIRTTGVVA